MGKHYLTGEHQLHAEDADFAEGSIRYSLCSQRTLRPLREIFQTTTKTFNRRPTTFSSFGE